MRLSGADMRRIRRDHAIVAVLARMGIDPPPYWDGRADYRVRAAALGLPHGPDDSQGVLIQPDRGRWWAFRAECGGDVLNLVRDVTGAATLADAAAILDRPGPIPITRTEPTTDTSPVMGWAERPDPHRTPPRRVLQVNTAAWDYLTLPKVADRAREYLAGRGIDLTALEAEVGAPLAGHTPASRTGLVEHLRGWGFTDEAIIDAGWGVRRPDLPLRDRYHHRVLLPFRDTRGLVLGVTGRDITGAAAAKYLNHPRTAIFDKSAILYRPHTPRLAPQATVIVCEGTLDALAIAAAAARAGASHHYAPLTQSGLSLTDRVAPTVFGLHPRPVVLCGDGDPTGQQATAAWVDRAMRVYHREVLTVTLPDRHDPASWLAQHGDTGLLAFTRPGCLNDHDHMRPRPAGGLLARHQLSQLMDAARARDSNVETVMLAHQVIDRLGRYAAHLPDPAAVERFAHEAGATLATLIDGLDTAVRTRQILDAARRHCFRDEPRLAAASPVREAVMIR